MSTHTASGDQEDPEKKALFRATYIFCTTYYDHDYTFDQWPFVYPRFYMQFTAFYNIWTTRMNLTHSFFKVC